MHTFPKFGYGETQIRTSDVSVTVEMSFSCRDSHINYRTQERLGNAQVVQTKLKEMASGGKAPGCRAFGQPRPRRHEANYGGTITVRSSLPQLDKGMSYRLDLCIPFTYATMVGSVGPPDSA